MVKPVTCEVALSDRAARLIPSAHKGSAAANAAKPRSHDRELRAVITKANALFPTAIAAIRRLVSGRGVFWPVRTSSIAR
jgi:hypothetical protein